MTATEGMTIAIMSLVSNFPLLSLESEFLVVELSFSAVLVWDKAVGFPYQKLVDCGVRRGLNGMKLTLNSIEYNFGNYTFHHSWTAYDGARCRNGFVSFRAS